IGGKTHRLAYFTHTHARTHTRVRKRTHARMHACTHARMHARTHARSCAQTRAHCARTPPPHTHTLLCDTFGDVLPCLFLSLSGIWPLRSAISVDAVSCARACARCGVC